MDMTTGVAFQRRKWWALKVPSFSIMGEFMGSFKRY